MSRRADLILAAVLLGLGLGVIVMARLTIERVGMVNDPVGPGGMAYAVGGAVSLGAVALLVRILVAPNRSAEASEAGKDDTRYTSSSARAVMIMALTLGYVLVLTPLGYVLSTVVYLAAALRVMGRSSLSRLVVYPCVFTAATFALFGPVLGVRMPHGVLAPALEAIGLA